MSGGVYKWQPRSPARDLLEASYAIAGSALIISGHIVSYKWYQSLPSIRRYGALFGINPLLVKYPFVLKAITLFSSVASVACLVTFILVLPIVEPERTETWAVATLGTLCGAVLSWGFNITYLTHLLLRIYRRAKWTILRRSTLNVQVHSLSSQGIHFGHAGRVALSIAKDSNEPDAVIYREFRSMRTILYGVLIMVGSGTLIISVLLLGSIFILEMQESLYITFSLVVICCELGALGLIYFAVFRTSERFQGCWPNCVCTKEPESSSVDASDVVAPVP
ncbi:Hypothetical Protein FCC1311_040682 [Hondaea fermentalgiana]|uniref:Uncharacterized protein n=1 Tax=Hondaea fermentalgiana TaxID=2315210 RepID=A0A2R5GB71_9STRA|nr:Hypothetical Protein FCC1311_040682 [Hondaea fermentalgiana]|eukprot:GBG27845.1 Hypothetical Protein FCC1311_040682 [Hondaea fermentalgiana]